MEGGTIMEGVVLLWSLFLHERKERIAAARKIKTSFIT
jgi:hypothetical protein